MAQMRHGVVTLTGSVQNLGTALASAMPEKGSLRFLSIQAFSSNAAVVYVGGANSVAALSNTNYGWRIEIPASSIPYAPSIIEMNNPCMSLSDFVILGANTEKVSVFTIGA